MFSYLFTSLTRRTLRGQSLTHTPPTFALIIKHKRTYNTKHTRNLTREGDAQMHFAKHTTCGENALLIRLNVTEQQIIYDASDQYIAFSDGGGECKLGIHLYRFQTHGNTQKSAYVRNRDRRGRGVLNLMNCCFYPLLYILIKISSVICRYPHHAFRFETYTFWLNFVIVVLIMTHLE